MKEYRIYTGNNCKIIKKNIPECLEALSLVSDRINNTFNDPYLNNMRNILITHIKTLLNKVNTCKDLSISEINSLYQPSPFQVLCLNRGFKQHAGECWNDSLMMFFCYQDGIKETVQKKLYFLEPEEIIELAYSKREINLPKMFDDIKYKTKFMNGITNYLRMMKTKFTTYYNNTKYPMSRDASISAAMDALEIIRQCPSDILNHGADYIETSLFIQILSYFLLDNELETELILKPDIKDSHIYNYLGFIVFWKAVVGRGGHATAIYTCDRTIYHFDDNNYNYSVASSYATPVRINNITQITNNNLYIGAPDEHTCMFLISIKFYNKTTDKIKRMNRFLEYEIDKNVFDNIQYYFGNGADKSKLDPIIEKAITNNKIYTIKSLLDYGANPNGKPTIYNSFIELAITKKHIEIVRLLLDKGVDPNGKPLLNNSYIDLAMQDNQIEIVRLLLDYGADPNGKPLFFGSYIDKAMNDNQIEIIRLLLDKGADPNKKINLRTYIDAAIGNNQIEIVRLLLDKGVDPNQRDLTGFSLLYNAINSGNVEIVRLLIAKGINKNDVLNNISNYDTILEYAIQQGNQEIINLLR
jgi:ankyrin repeat protein